MAEKSSSESNRKASKAKKVASAKTSSKADDFRAKSADELGDQLVELKKEQFNLRFQRANGQAREYRPHPRPAPGHRPHPDGFDRTAPQRRPKA